MVSFKYELEWCMLGAVASSWFIHYWMVECFWWVVIEFSPFFYQTKPFFSPYTICFFNVVFWHFFGPFLVHFNQLYYLEDLCLWGFVSYPFHLVSFKYRHIFRTLGFIPITSQTVRNCWTFCDSCRNNVTLKLYVLSYCSPVKHRNSAVWFCWSKRISSISFVDLNEEF
jgi:hypothetical protein